MPVCSGSFDLFRMQPCCREGNDMEYILQTDGLTKCFRGFRALDGLAMHVPKGSIYGFVGRNGAGKTTLFRLICGMQRPTSGSFELFGISNGSKDIAGARR